MDAALAGDDALARALGHPVVPGWATFVEALAPTRAVMARDPGQLVWGTRMFLAGEPPALVGWGGFKGPPRHGVVELGYEIAESLRGRGLATGAARAMLEEAFADALVSSVIAHTMPGPNASTRVLAKCGFVYECEATEDGERVWRHRITRAVFSGAS